jgi:dienelactone hydrolase
VMLTGFSLGGITAGAIAAEPHGYNIQQVVTAGAPIGGMNIPSATHVTAFEARQDAVPTLDGAANPSSWTTIHQNAYRLANEDMPFPSSPANAHLADRYGVMAKANPAVNNDPAIGKFFRGTLTVTDQYATR